MSQENCNDPSSGDYTSLRDLMLAELERLREIMRGNGITTHEEYLNLSEVEKESLNEFLTYFSVCPICKEKNHEPYLRQFFFDPSPSKRILKERLLKLIGESRDFYQLYHNKISVGIPCCTCFSNFFENKRRENRIQDSGECFGLTRNTPLRDIIMAELRELFQSRSRE